jgi:hypothetical protein
MRNYHSYADQKTAVLVKEQGIYLTTRTSDKFLIELYAIENFFVEIWYLDGEGKVDIKTEIHDDISCLDPYLKDEVSFLILKSLEDY